MRVHRPPVELSGASGVPFYRQIVDQIAGLIRSGQLAPGTQLPPFRDLAPQLRVSLITVRRAYADLEQAGLIVKRQGQGTSRRWSASPSPSSCSPAPRSR
jgi:GntR family transcriptional regulator